MVGREVLESLERTWLPPGEIVLALEHVEADGDKGVEALRGVDLEVRSGEIVGIAAVAGNGQSELAEVICGLRHCRGRDPGRRRGHRQPSGPQVRSSGAWRTSPRTGRASGPRPTCRSSTT